MSQLGYAWVFLNTKPDFAIDLCWDAQHAVIKRTIIFIGEPNFIFIHITKLKPLDFFIEQAISLYLIILDSNVFFHDLIYGFELQIKLLEKYRFLFDMKHSAAFNTRITDSFNNFTNSRNPLICFSPQVFIQFVNVRNVMDVMLIAEDSKVQVFSYLFIVRWDVYCQLYLYILHHSNSQFIFFVLFWYGFYILTLRVLLLFNNCFYLWYLCLFLVSFGV